MLLKRNSYIRVVYISPLGKEREEISDLLYHSEAMTTATTLDSDCRRGIRPDITRIYVETLKNAV